MNSAQWEAGIAAYWQCQWQWPRVLGPHTHLGQDALCIMHNAQGTHEVQLSPAASLQHDVGD